MFVNHSSVGLALHCVCINAEGHACSMCNNCNGILPTFMQIMASQGCTTRYCTLGVVQQNTPELQCKTSFKKTVGNSMGNE